TVEKIFDIATTAPGVVVTDVTVKRAGDGLAFGCALDQIRDVEVGTVLGVCEDVCTPKIHIPLVIAVPLGTRQHELLDFLSILSKIATSGNRAGVVTKPRGHRRFGFGLFVPEEPGKGNKDVSHGRVLRATEQRRNVKARTCCRFPCKGWTDHKSVLGIAACVFDGEILILHFQADFQALVRQENGSHDALGEAPFAAAIAGVLFFEEPVHGPLNVLAEILGEEQAKFVGIGNLGRSALFLFFFFLWWWRSFFVSNSADTEFVFGEERWIERNVVPLSKSPSCFYAHCFRAPSTFKSFELCFRGHPKTIRQTHFDLLSEKMIGRSMAEPLALVNLSEEKCPWRQNVGLSNVGETAAGKGGRSSVRAGHFLAGND